MKKNNYDYPLRTSWQSEGYISDDGKLIVEDQFSDDFSRYTFLLRLAYRSTSRKQGVVFTNGTEISNSQYFEAKQEGVRYLNLTGVSELNDITIKTKYCQIDSKVTLIACRNPDLSSGAILILSPHADDAELAAYGLYSDFASQTWIATINIGSDLQSLKRQYISNLDKTKNEAERRKGVIRSWNSITTPLLAKVPQNQLLCLGYFGISSKIFNTEPERVIEHVTNPDLTPEEFRCWNHLKLSNDIKSKNSASAMVTDIAELIEHIKPTTVLVTHPQIDPHDEHIVAAKALHSALQVSDFIPENILCYANHLRDVKNFPYGPEHSRTAFVPWFGDSKDIEEFSIYSHPLNLARQKEKVLAFDTMHDLRSKDRLEKKVKQWFSRKVSKSGYQYYANHSYFQTHIKADEVFACMSGIDFRASRISFN